MYVSLTNLTVLLLSLFIGIIYTFICYQKNSQRYVITQRKDTYKNFYHHLPLILFNISILSLLSFVGIYFFSNFFDTHAPSILIFVTQFLIIMVFDDVEFYFWHRFLHRNKFMLRKIHFIHHRVVIPFPLEFIYVHPIEWIGGTIGLITAFILIANTYGSINAYVLWSYTAYRTLHELDIHSNLRPMLIKYIPFFGNSKDHALHHLHPTGNYASMFTYLDKIFRTEIIARIDEP